MVQKEVPRLTRNVLCNFREVSVLSLPLSSMSKTEIHYLFRSETGGDGECLAAVTKKEATAVAA